MSTNESNITLEVAKCYLYNAYSIDSQNIQGTICFKRGYYFITDKNDRFFVYSEDDGKKVIVSTRVGDNDTEGIVSYEIVTAEGEKSLKKSSRINGIDCVDVYEVSEKYSLPTQISSFGKHKKTMLPKNQFSLETAEKCIAFLGLGDELTAPVAWKANSDGNGFLIETGNGKKISIKLTIHKEELPFVSVMVTDKNNLIAEHRIMIDNADNQSMVYVNTIEKKAYVLSSATTYDTLYSGEKLLVR